MEERKYCVYIHTNKINGKKYIGQTCQTPEQRWGTNGRRYLCKNKKGVFHQPAFANAIIKYGWEGFSHEVIANELTKDEANSLEQKLIKQYKTTDSDFGYNIQEGGTPDISGENNPMYGKTADKLTAEERYARGKSMRGKHHLEETKEKISESNKKYYQTHEHHMTRTHRTEEFKTLMHNKMLNREFSESTKKKMSKNHADVSGGNNPRAKAVRCIETGEVFPSAADAGRAYELSSKNPGTDIRQCCKGKKETAAKDKITNEPLHWEWVN